MESIKKCNNRDYRELYAVMFMLGVMLFLRDAYGVNIHKYIFLLIIATVSFIFPIDKTMCLIAFIMPLYVGLPGNYLTLIFLVRFLVEGRKFKLNGYNLVFCILTGGYIVVQCMITQHTAIAELMFFPGLVLVMFMFAKGIYYDKAKLIVCYCAGVAALGLIMLVSTLRVYDLSDLLDVSFRLGSSNVDYINPNIMNVSVDPNFYGAFVVAALSTSVPLIVNSTVNKMEKIFLAVCAVVSGCVVLVGLSRASVIILLLWGLLYALSQRKAKDFFITLIAIFLCIFLAMTLMPNFVEALVERFHSEDLASGNGRIELIEKFTVQWWRSIFSILFGVGLFNCNVHCTPLQVLFGGGLILVILMLGYVITLRQNKSQGDGSHNSFERILPLLVTGGMMLTIPAIALINFMYPIILVGLCGRDVEL